MMAARSQVGSRWRRVNGQTLLVVVLMVVVPLGTTDAVFAQSAASDRPSGSSATTSAAGVAVTHAVAPGIGDLVHFGKSVAHIVTAPADWSVAQWLVLPVAGGALVVLSALDDEGRDFMRRQRDQDLTRFGDEFERLGTVSNYGILLGFYAAGLAFDDRKARMVAVEAVASSLIAAGVITPTLQLITGRSRPRTGRDPHSWAAFSRNISFPSGHTTQAFSVASVIATEYEQLWVKATAYGLASLVGLCRMYDGAHYLTDVTAAALIGTAVGRSVAHFGQKERSTLTVRPVSVPGGVGIGLSFRF